MNEKIEERPILFSDDMVQVTLDGRKTQARRVVKPQPDEDGLVKPLDQDQWEDTSAKSYRCRYGEPGDRLWVREFFHLGTCPNDPSPGLARYSDGSAKLHKDAPSGSMDWCRMWKKRPSIRMPRWASRITLEITGIRVERLQDISEEDAKAEGVTIRTDARIASHFLEGEQGPAQLEFYALWDSISKHPWDSNPWVWVIEFKQITP